MNRRWLIFFLFIGLGVAFLLGLRFGETTGARSSLRQVFEVRNRIHQSYVEEVDSMRVIDAAIDGLVAVLPEGENIYISPAEMAEVEAPERLISTPRLDDRGQVALLEEVFRHVSRQYVARVSADTLSRGLVWGMLAALDPHSSYLNADEYTEMAERFRGDFEGIGIYFEIRQGKLMVIAPIVGSPSYGKLRAGDQIVQIEGVSTEGITNEQVMKKLRGAPGTRVRVSVSRQGKDEPFDVVIQRDRIEVHSVPYAYMLRPDLGYIRITRFAETTGQELNGILEKLLARGMERLLLDLRGNSGGLLSQAVEVADSFLDRGELVVYTEGRTPISRQEYRAEHPLEGYPLSLVVLIDHGSASASEIVAGAIQDLDIGLIAGQTSFGKGLVQEQFPLSNNGGLLLLTVARYYTPLGRLIQRPYTDDIQAYIQEGLDDFDPNSVDSLRAAKSIFHTAMGRAVYGGGGITPDLPLGEEIYSDFALNLFASGVLSDFSSHWVGTRESWQDGFDPFRQHYEISQEALDAFQRYLTERGISASDEQLTAHRDFLRRELKAGIAQVLWGDEERYRIRLEGDQQMLQALDLFPRADELARARSARSGAGY